MFAIIKSPKIYALLLLLVGLTYACSLFDHETVQELDSLGFHKTTYKTTEPLILTGSSESDLGEYKLRRYPTVLVYSSPENYIHVKLKRWRDLSPGQLNLALDHSDRKAIISVKEREYQYSYDQKNHRYLTSRETVFETAEILSSMGGVEVLDVHARYPYINVAINRDIDLIDQIIKLKTVEVMNPDFPIQWIDDEVSSQEQALSTHQYPVQVPLAAVIATDQSIHPSLEIEPGDSVFLEYVQPDESIIKRKAYIEEN